MKPFLKLSSVCALLWFCGCVNPYKKLVPAPGNQSSALRFKPAFERELYRCVVDGKFLFKKFHLSGILLFKTMPDSSTRVVFSNEMGISFFDFEWSKDESFKVNSIIPQLDKEVVKKILQRDFELLLMKRIDLRSEVVLSDSHQQKMAMATSQYDLYYHRFGLDKGNAYYLATAGNIRSIQQAGKRSVVTDIGFSTLAPGTLADSIRINHHKAHFTIELKKINDDVQ